MDGSYWDVSNHLLEERYDDHKLYFSWKKKKQQNNNWLIWKWDKPAHHCKIGERYHTHLNDCLSMKGLLVLYPRKLINQWSSLPQHLCQIKKRQLTYCVILFSIAKILLFFFFSKNKIIHNTKFIFSLVSNIIKKLIF